MFVKISQTVALNVKDKIVVIFNINDMKTSVIMMGFPAIQSEHSFDVTIKLLENGRLTE